MTTFAGGIWENHKKPVIIAIVPAESLTGHLPVRFKSVTATPALSV
jgi:hypothetical protein